MACCQDSDCIHLIIAGENIELSGSGSPTNPLVINATFPDFTQLLRVNDTTTLNLRLLGSATPGDPYELSGDVTMRVNDLNDVDDPSGAPADGESLVYSGTYPTGHWEYGTLPPSPAGSVNVENGIVGVGSVGDPIGVNTSGVWGVGDLAGLGSDTTIGLETYIDVDGKVRVQPPPTSIAWDDITGKPATFTPSAHTHTASAITDPLNLDVGKVRGKSLHTSNSSSSAPSSGQVTALGLWFFPKGS